LVGSFDL